MTAIPRASSDLPTFPVSPSTGSPGGQSCRSGGLRPACPILTYLLPGLYRSLREPANLFFVTTFLVAMYLVFGRLNAPAGGYGLHTHGNVSVSAMFVMVPFSACPDATSVSAAATVEQSVGRDRQMAVTSRGPHGYLVVKTGTAAGTVALPVAVALTIGALTDSQMEGQVWVVGLLICLIGVLFFILWGLAAGIWLPPSAPIGVATFLASLSTLIGNALMPLSHMLLMINRFTLMYGATVLARWSLDEGWAYASDRQAGIQDPLWMPLANLVVWILIPEPLVIGARCRATRRL